MLWCGIRFSYQACSWSTVQTFLITTSQHLGVSENSEHLYLSTWVCRTEKGSQAKAWGPLPPVHVPAMVKGSLALRLLSGKEGETLIAKVRWRILSFHHWHSHWFEQDKYNHLKVRNTMIMSQILLCGSGKSCYSHKPTWTSNLVCLPFLIGWLPSFIARTSQWLRQLITFSRKHKLTKQCNFDMLCHLCTVFAIFPQEEHKQLESSLRL